MDAADLPKSRRALLLVDFINPLDFPGAADLVPGAIAAARVTARLAAECRRLGMPVIYANDNFGSWTSDFASIVKALETSKGAGSELVRILKPHKADLTVLKPMHSAFLGSPLDILLQKMGTKSLIITGLATDICVQITAMDAFLRGLKVHVPDNCTAAESLEQKNAALRYMRKILKCRVSPWKPVVDPAASLKKVNG